MLDPSRRITTASGRSRARSPEDYTPPLSWARALAEVFPFVAIKLSPFLDDHVLQGWNSEVEFLSHRGECKEAVLWLRSGSGEPPGVSSILPPLEAIEHDAGIAAKTGDVPDAHGERSDQGAAQSGIDPRTGDTPASAGSRSPMPDTGETHAHRPEYPTAAAAGTNSPTSGIGDTGPPLPAGYTATVIGEDGTGITLRSSGAPPAEVGTPLGYLLEPDPAVIRAHLTDEIAAAHNALRLDPVTAYLTSETAPQSPFVSAYRIRCWMPFNLKRVREEVRRQRLNVETVKKRGVPLDVDEIRHALRDAANSDSDRIVLVLGLVNGKPAAIFCDQKAPVG